MERWGALRGEQYQGSRPELPRGRTARSPRRRGPGRRATLLHHALTPRTPDPLACPRLPRRAQRNLPRQQRRPGEPGARLPAGGAQAAPRPRRRPVALRPAPGGPRSPAATRKKPPMTEDLATGDRLQVLWDQEARCYLRRATSRVPSAPICSTSSGWIRSPCLGRPRPHRPTTAGETRMPPSRRVNLETHQHEPASFRPFKTSSAKNGSLPPPPNTSAAICSSSMGGVYAIG